MHAGVPLAGSSDSSVADYNLFVGIWSAIARETAAGAASHVRSAHSVMEWGLRVSVIFPRD